MKESANIDELLNSFIDGELAQRPRIEVQRLISHDAQVARRLLELQRCKILVSSLPRAEAPPDIAEQVKASLERRTLLGEQPSDWNERKGAKHLLFRKVLTAAAMIGLVAVLAATVYLIVVPEKSIEKPLVFNNPLKPTAGAGVVGKPTTTVAAVEFDGKLELKTSNFAAVNAFISRAVEDNGLLEKVGSENRADKSIYTLNCSGKGASLLLADLEKIWEKFDSPTLFVETGRFDKQVAVESVNTEQIAEIIKTGNLEKRIKLAKNFAFLNSMASLLPGKEMLAATSGSGANLITIPKPVLTKSEKTIKKSVGRTEGKTSVHLTIVIVAAK